MLPRFNGDTLDSRHRVVAVHSIVQPTERTADVATQAIRPPPSRVANVQIDVAHRALREDRVHGYLDLVVNDFGSCVTATLIERTAHCG